jgi:hypothetical protein
MASLLTGTKGEMRGLTIFISDLRNAANKEEEESRVNREMARIRRKFKEKSKSMSGYDRKKYVCKILYMYLLGYEPDFGYSEALNLLSSNKHSEKQIGYLTLSLVLHEDHEMIPLMINSLRNDLESQNEYFTSLALATICNIGGKTMAESLAPLVQKIFLSAASPPTVRKKAAMCMLRLFQKYPSIIQHNEWVQPLRDMMDEPDFGILTAVMSFATALARANPEPFLSLYSKVVNVLVKILVLKRIDRDYVYYRIPAPWLQVKLLKFLQLFPPPNDSQVLENLNECLKRIIDTAVVAKGPKINHKNAFNAVFFEAVNTVIHLNTNRSLMKEAMKYLGEFMSDAITNFRYLGLEAMKRIALLSSAELDANDKSNGLTSTQGLSLEQYQEKVIIALQDPDISIRRRALDLLYGMCNRKTSKVIVLELLGYLQSLNVNISADFAIREELVLKIALLVEKYAPSHKWYVDIMLKLITLAGDVMSDEISFRVIRVVTNHTDIQEYATRTLFTAMLQPNCNETTVRIGGYLLGEFGNLIRDNVNSTPEKQIELLRSKFLTVSESTRAMLLTTFIKLVNLYPEQTARIMEIFKQNANSLNVEIQQRSCEYARLAALGDDELLQKVCELMPPFGTTEETTESSDSQGTDSTDSHYQPESISKMIQESRERQEQYQLQYAQEAQQGDEDNDEPDRDEEDAVYQRQAAAGSSSTTVTAYPGTLEHYIQTRQQFLSELQKLEPSLRLTDSQQTQLQQLLLLQQQTALSPIQQQQLQQLLQIKQKWDENLKQQQLLRQQLEALQSERKPQSLPDATNQRADTIKKGVFGSGTESITSEFENVVKLARTTVSTSNPFAEPQSQSQLQSQQQLLEQQKQKLAFRNLCLRNDGVLFENNALQIGFKSEWKQGQGRIALYFGNKTTVPLTNFNFNVSPNPYMQLEVIQTIESGVVAALAQGRVIIAVVCLTPFLEGTYPIAQISFVAAGTPSNMTFELPINIARFIEPMVLDTPRFFRMWSSIQNPPESAEEVFRAAAVINMTTIQKLLSIGCRLAILSEVENNIHNFACAGTLFCTQFGGGLVCLLRLETHPGANMMRLTVKSPNAQVTQAIKSLIVSLLVAPKTNS